MKKAFIIIRWRTQFKTHLCSRIRHGQGLLKSFSYCLQSVGIPLPSPPAANCPHPAMCVHLFLSCDLHLPSHTVILPFTLSFLHFTS